MEPDWREIVFGIFATLTMLAMIVGLAFFAVIKG